MHDMILTTLFDPPFQIILVIVLVAGIVRGFSGFGTGMIVFPPTAAVFSPQTALVMMFVMDSWPSVPLLVKCRKLVDWPELLPVMAGLALTMPLGILFLKFGDVNTLRWFVSVIILIVVALMASGWHYKGSRTGGISFLVGNMCGFLSGSSGLTGPPAILYWMAKRTGAGIVRANMLMLLFLSELLLGFGFLFANIFTWEAIIKGILITPPYMMGLLIGQSFFTRASDGFYRNFAFFLILAIAITSSPLMDPYLR